MEVIADVFEKSIEIFLNYSELSPQEVSPFDEHVVECDKGVIQFSQALSFGDAVEHLS